MYGYLVGWLVQYIISFVGWLVSGWLLSLPVGYMKLGRAIFEWVFIIPDGNDYIRHAWFMLGCLCNVVEKLAVITGAILL